jgi:predicted secreted protein
MNFKSTFIAFACALMVTGSALAMEPVNGTVFTASPISVKTGQEFLIALPGNATTGYSWTAKSSGPAVAVEGSAYQGSSSQRMGAGGQQIFIFEAGKPGSATVTFSYGRPWQKNTKPARTMTFAITVTK